MKFYSTNHKSPSVGLKEAVMTGLAADGGLYMPERIPVIPRAFFNNIADMSVRDIAYVVADTLLHDDIDSAKLKTIVNDTFTFDIPLVNVDEDIYSLELFHGPTLAFKDIGARFLARIISHYSAESRRPVKVIVATSGDSGGAVAAGFKDVPGLEVYILYPQGRLSPMQRQQLDVGAGNIHAIEVIGTFDDCQAMAKKAFCDTSLRKDFDITSANSINVCRLIPQLFSFFHGYASLLSNHDGPSIPEIVISVPSGNLGNLCAGLSAWKMGLPVKRFIVSNNSNDVTVNYLLTGNFLPRRAVKTVACAMDVGNPSNLARILELFAGDHGPLARLVHGYSYSDKAITDTMSDVYNRCGYLMDPHSASAYAALKTDLQKGEKGIFLSTAHPAKFARTVKEATGFLPTVTQSSPQRRTNNHPRISPSYDALKRIIM